MRRRIVFIRNITSLTRIAVALLLLCSSAMPAVVWAGERPSPLLAAQIPVNWWFVFKFNSKSFPGCANNAARSCPFGGVPQGYPYFSQQYVYASDTRPKLALGQGCLGNSAIDPVGATYQEIYDGKFFYVVWNDQFYSDPPIKGCGDACGSPWGHSKGMVAWDEDGNGLVLQVTTPSWPAAGSNSAPRRSDGNTLGCVRDNDVEVSQHFFALRLTRDDVVALVKALSNSSVVTDIHNPQIVRNGGPQEIQTIVNELGVESRSHSFTQVNLSSGVSLISKPSALHVPPWQFVSALLGGIDIRVASWWANPRIPSTTNSTTVACWFEDLGRPGAISIATSGKWNRTNFGLKGGAGRDFNHAKIGVAEDGSHHFVILGDLNQQGSLSGPNCASSQNGRGGLFYVIDNEELENSVNSLIAGDTAETE